ncbi:Transcriptional activator protein acu-15 [Mycena sanguinolenta]|uniref:Transcriptional activator protein acu-15 n=1 Tax=Mycena sanguinolenta TaxID=230812 RepID=A0A8H7CU62_9AGAR|nr:Transcriptional activator protein acu-15 [Mycena sanguinolenta]
MSNNWQYLGHLFLHIFLGSAQDQIFLITISPAPSTPEASPELTEAFLDVFLHHFSRHHFFFLNPTQFKQSASLPDLLPRGLLNAVVLWANRVSANSIADSTYSDKELLAQTIHHVARDIAVVEPLLQHMLHLIQTEVLLALYYLDCGRLLEGNYHRAGAASLAFSMGLHQLGPLSQGSYPFGIGILAQMGTPAQISDVARTEMIDAFWSVVILNNYFVAASDIPSSIPCDASIRTPWPTHFLNIATPVPFTPGNDLAGHSPLTLLAKASIQLERTIAFTTRIADLPPPPEFWAMETRLETFRDHLPPFDANCPTDQVTLVTHSFVNVAIIRLYSSHTGVHADACLIAAYCIAARLADARIAEWKMADPILGPLLATVADVFIANLDLDAQAATAIQTTLSVMKVLACRSPLIRMSNNYVNVGLYLTPEQSSASRSHNHDTKLGSKI